MIANIGGGRTGTIGIVGTDAGVGSYSYAGRLAPPIRDLLLSTLSPPLSPSLPPS